MNQIKAGVILNFAIIGLNTLTGLLYTPYMMRCLGQNEYGLYSLVASIIAYLTVLDTGFSSAAIRFTARLRPDGDTSARSSLIGMILLTNTILSLIVIAAGAIIYLNIDNLFDRTMTPADISQARIMLIMLIINLAITFPLGVFTSILKAYERFIFVKTLNLLRISLVTLTIVALLYHGHKAVAMVAVQTIFNLLMLLVNYIHARRSLRIRVSFRHFSRPLFKEITVYSFWLFLNSIINRIYWSTGQFILGIVSGTIAVAIFSAAIVIQQMYQTLSGAIADVLLPRITTLTAASAPGSSRRISDIFITTGRLQASLLMLITSGFIVFGQSFFTLWAGPGYSTSFLVTLIIFIAIFPYSVQNVGSIILQARNQLRYITLVELTVALLSIIGQYYLGRAYGPVGCAAAIGIALFIGPGLLFNRYYRRRQHIDTPLFWRQILRMTPIPILMTILGLLAARWLDLTHPATFAAALLIYLLLYLPLFWRHALTPADRTLLHRRSA